MKRILFFVAIFAQLSLAKTPLGFIFFGDAGTGGSDQMEVAQGMQTFCASNLCEFGLMLGDNFYPAGVSNVNDPQIKAKFEIPYHPLGLDFFVALGNHDYMSNVDAELEYVKKNSRWKMPSRYYTFVQKNARFFVLDTEKFDEAQAKWLANAIQQSNSQWKIVIGHHPIFSYGAHADNTHLIRNLLPRLKGKTDMYLAGHDHDLQIIEKDGYPFIVSGAAGKLRPVKSGLGTVYADSKLGFSHLKIEGDKAHLSMVDKNAKVLFQRTWKKTQDSTIPGNL